MVHLQFVLFGLIALANSAWSFPTYNSCSTATKTHFNAVKGKSSNRDPEVSFLLEDFRTASGSLVDPYKLLGVSRTATKMEIKASYRKLSRKLHPDMVMNRDILPGKCANLDEVREEWEKVKLSYEILTDKKMRLKYDRNSAVADPGAAMGRAAISAVGWGLTSVGQGFWKIGEQVVKAGKSSSSSVSSEEMNNGGREVAIDTSQEGKEISN